MLRRAGCNDTGMSGSKSDAIEHDYVPGAIQEAVSKRAEMMIMNGIDDAGKN